MVSRVDAPHATAPADAAPDVARLRNFYVLRALVAAGWVALALTFGRTMPVTAAVLLVAYPAWDALANLIDARASGGLARNRTQAINLAMSVATAAAVAIMIGNMNAVLGIFGVWAIVSGLMQLATGVRRWKAYGAQWAMVLSGGQSALAGGHFIVRALGTAVPGIADIAPYAAFGAFYFLVSALWLAFRRA